jgi:uncharacterized protein (DUF924 family)
MNDEAERILAFWIDDVGPDGWYLADAALDARCRDGFLETWERARTGAWDGWKNAPRSALALLILLDQFPRNMFRGDARAFATDARARSIAKYALGRGHDLRVEGPQRQFFYLPLMHSESVPDQDRSVRLFLMRYDAPEQLRHARAHRAVIRRFGRFPYRNAPLGRATTAEEAAWLAQGGYAQALETLEAA